MNAIIEKFLDFGRTIIPQSVFEAAQPYYHKGLSYLAAIWYGFPARNMTVVGVTGTNGKSTVVYMIDKILSGAGNQTASLSTIEFKMGELAWPNNLKMTMPGRFAVQKFLSQALFAGCKYLVLEVTSQGIVQSRHLYIDFAAAVLTNLTPEHIEAHGGFENYKEAKLTLFKQTKTIHILPESQTELKEFYDLPADKKIYFSPLKNDLDLKLKLPGEFNLQNALAAAAAARALGVADALIKNVLENIESVPGRAENIKISAGAIGGEFPKDFKVIVDYAHTPVALEKIYQTFSATSPLICVLGSAGGGRDKWKRPEFGKIAEKYCKQIILTNEDPYEENPKTIIEEIEAGISPEKKSTAVKILDRREAIQKAISLAATGDTVLITGKGSEETMAVGKNKIFWSDKRIVKETLTGILHPKTQTPSAPETDKIQVKSQK